PQANCPYRYRRVLRRTAAFSGQREPASGCFTGAPPKGRGRWMSVESLSEDSVLGYSPEPRRSLIAMFSRRARGFVTGPASHVLVRPFVVFAARALGPGPTRLRLVKLAHNLDHQPL